MSQETETDFPGVRKEIAKWLSQMNNEQATIFKIMLSQAATETAQRSHDRLAALRKINKKAQDELCLQSFMAY